MDLRQCNCLVFGQRSSRVGIVAGPASSFLIGLGCLLRAPDLQGRYCVQLVAACNFIVRFAALPSHSGRRRRARSPRRRGANPIGRSLRQPPWRSSRILHRGLSDTSLRPVQVAALPRARSCPTTLTVNDDRPLVEYEMRWLSPSFSRHRRTLARRSALAAGWRSACRGRHQCPRTPPA